MPAAVGGLALILHRDLRHMGSKSPEPPTLPKRRCAASASLSSRPATIGVVTIYTPTSFHMGDEPPGLPRALFSEQEFGSVLEERVGNMIREIEEYPANELLNTGMELLLDYFYDRYSIDIPVLDEQNMSVQPPYEVKVRNTSPYGEPATFPGFRYKIIVPFTGNPRVFNSRPSASSTMQPPIAYLDEAALTFAYDQTDLDRDALKARLEEDLATVQQYLQLLGAEADSLNSGIHPRGAEYIQQRRARLLKAHGIAASLGIRFERTGLPATYNPPQIQRRPRVVRPKASTDPYVPEPALEMAEYENILDILRAITVVIERNPTKFGTADEALIRDLFLTQLNVHYKGQATGETFNSQGKCDILVRIDDKNIFIAEVKFWDGAQSITKALRQLLTRYATWRDSKIALIILNRRRNFSAVLAQIPAAIDACGNVLRHLDIAGESDFRYVLQHPDDPNKELLLTVMCFEVPPKRGS